jgi:Dual specificity phosphatase, catalytic domain
MAVCSGVLGEVRPRLLLTDALGAASATALCEAKVTHVLNAAAFVCANHFEAELDHRGGEALDENSAHEGAVAGHGPQPAGYHVGHGAQAIRLHYRSLWLQDSPVEDLLCVLYDALDWTHAALASGGVVLVHCSQGVSRSAALVCAYLMWSEKLSFDAAFEAVKAARCVASPNIGFSCQLMQWGRRITPLAFAAQHPRLYRAGAHSPADPCHIVLRHVQRSLAGRSWLHASKSLVLATSSAMWAWRTADCPAAYWATALRFADQLSRFEGAAGPAMQLVEGEEGSAFLDALEGCGGEDSARASEEAAAAMPAELRRFALGERSRDACRAGVGAQEKAAAAGALSTRRCGPAPHASDDPPLAIPRTLTNRL